MPLSASGSEADSSKESWRDGAPSCFMVTVRGGESKESSEDISVRVKHTNMEDRYISIFFLFFLLEADIDSIMTRIFPPACCHHTAGQRLSSGHLCI
jgi:hypothetical protein